MNDFAELIQKCAEEHVIRKIVFSKPDNTETVRVCAVSKIISGGYVIQFETFASDNKAYHKNVALSDIAREAEKMLPHFSQINLMTSVGECEFKRSKNGKETLLGAGGIKAGLEKQHETVSCGANNKEKNHILSGDEKFLYLLGISDSNGRIYDKKQSKFRQINRFLEYVRDAAEYLPKTGALNIYDLCCGKSYLSFAVYHYFANVLGREVAMTGADLKADVVSYCNGIAEKLGFSGLRFECVNIKELECGKRCDLVLSLHACDIATDIVLDFAVRNRAAVVLSTPCCHHEMNHKINCGELSFITEHPMLRQKLCDAATDALRILKMEANGYVGADFELIDPEDTPKNILLRFIRKSDGDEKKKEEFLFAKKFLLGDNETEIL